MFFALDSKGREIELTQPTAALKFTKLTSVSTSQEITLNAQTSLIEVTAIDGNIYLKYGIDNAVAATDGADECILAGSTRHYIIPVDSNNVRLFDAINLIDDADSAKVIVIEK